MGTVGSAFAHYFEKKGKKPVLYDKFKKSHPKEKINGADIIFICVPTPYRKKGGFDLSLVEETVSFIEEGKTIVIKSTVLPGSTDRLQEENPGKKILFSPEFLREATAKKDIFKPKRQIVGFTEKSKDVAQDVLDILPPAPFEMVMPAKEAEMVKYFGNTFLASKVIFANQIYDLCEKLGIDYDLVRKAASADERIGKSHLDVWHADYRGYGGKCFPKDIKALIQLADEAEVDLSFHKAVEEINNRLMKEQGVGDPEKLSAKDEND